MKTSKIENLRDLFIERGRELYDTTRQEQSELPRIGYQVRNQQLKKIIEQQVAIAWKQSDRLQAVLNKLNAEPGGVKDFCCEFLLGRVLQMANNSRTNEVRDAAIINSIQRIIHSKITGFGSLAAYARQMGEQEVAQALHEAADLERSTDRQLTVLAQAEINKKAELAETE